MQLFELATEVCFLAHLQCFLSVNIAQSIEKARVLSIILAALLSSIRTFLFATQILCCMKTIVDFFQFITHSSQQGMRDVSDILTCKK